MLVKGANLCCILPVVIFVLTKFTYADDRPEWVKHFDTVEFDFDDCGFPRI